MSKQSTSTSWPLYAAVGAAIAIAAAWIAYSKLAADGGGGSSSAVGTAKDGGSADESFASEDERIAYVAATVEVADLAIGPDQKPDDAGPVPGVLRVSGAAHNKGDRALRSIRIVVHPQSNTGKVLGTYIEDILRNERLGPGETKVFKFMIPEKPEFSGKFMHEVR
jgi:hypothetical protein